MTETIFQFITYAPGPFWLLILFLPGNRKAMLAVDLFLILLAGIFFANTVPLLKELWPMLVQPDFASIREFTGSEKGALGSWNHMILGDLWIGRWVAQDTLKSRHHLIQRLIFIPPILFFGPFGVFLYLIFRIISRRDPELTRPL
ncbi:MAG: DUF4281 domain-containing protein [Verrucomicrobiales bacterium]|nr:DUF4281 domain-containing protein [Verrucomicrobiales bacterium]